jgi:Relaxase/Mobilisation nuclease domain
MATIKHSATKQVNRLINYCEKRAGVTSSHNLIADDRKSVQKQIKLTREMFNKTGGVEGHHFIQSFKPGEVSPEKANELGLELVKRMHPKREAVVYTHTDKGHIHNHIILNSPSIEDGKKLSVTRKHYFDWQRQNDAICKENGLSIVTEKKKQINKTLAEYHIMVKGKLPFKTHLRAAIDLTKVKCASFKEFQTFLKDPKLDIDSKIQKGHYYFKTKEMTRFISGKQLGNEYTKEVLDQEFIKRQKQNEREFTPRFVTVKDESFTPRFATIEKSKGFTPRFADKRSKSQDLDREL